MEPAASGAPAWTGAAGFAHRQCSNFEYHHYLALKNKNAWPTSRTELT
jgi:hypothetical protein